MKIIVQFLGTNYEIEADDATCNRIVTDPVFAQAYMLEHLGNQTVNTEEGILVPQNGQNSTEDLLVESPWEHRTVLLFLEECSKHKYDLRNPKIRRRTVFCRIKEAMQLKGYSFKASSLEKKLANLKTRYNRILDNNKKTSTGRGRISWPYFDQMCLVYEEEVSVRDAPTVSSLAASSPAHLSTPSTSRAEQKPTSSAGIRPKLLALEEEKVAIAREVLNELKELRILKQKRLEFEMKKYNEEKDARK